MSRETDISKFMSLVLRHSPQDAGLMLDESGWTDFSALCAAVEERLGASPSEVMRVIEDSPKKRFTLAGNRIRAAQGHSVDVNLGLRAASPPELLFHGTKKALWPAILLEGLTKQGRHHVHLSADIESARGVAARRKGENVILSVDAGTMSKEGIAFYMSDNGVWLTDVVAPRFLTPTSVPVEA